jgi:putative phosphoesterase
MTTVTALLLSDTHGQLHPSILRLTQRADLVIHAGDIGNPDILDQLAASGTEVFAVCGNNDTPSKWPSEAIDRLHRLPETARVELPGGTITVEHGHRANPVSARHHILRQRHADSRLVVYGHSHRCCIDDDATPWIVNPGAAGRSRTYGGSSCLLLTASNRAWHLQPQRFALSNWKR